MVGAACLGPGVVHATCWAVGCPDMSVEHSVLRLSGANCYIKHRRCTVCFTLRIAMLQCAGHRCGAVGSLQWPHIGINGIAQHHTGTYTCTVP